MVIKTYALKAMAVVTGLLAVAAMAFQVKARKAKEQLAEASMKASKAREDRLNEANKQLNKAQKEGQKRVKSNKFNLNSDD